MEYEKFLAWAEGKGWTVARRGGVPLSLPETVTRRYRVPEDYLRFLSEVLLCSGPMDTEWFLCEEGYRQEDPDAFRWDECERISLDAAQDMLDPEEEARVAAFWDGVLPFFLSVGNGYEYYGFDLAGRFGPVGGVIHGWEPMFEDAEAFSDSFPAFLERVMAGDVTSGGVLFDPEEYAFMEMEGRKEQERHMRETAAALQALLHPEQGEPDHGEDCGCGHHHHHEGDGCGCGHHHHAHNDE